MTIAYWCVLFMGLFPIVAAGIAKKGFEGYDNGLPSRRAFGHAPMPLKPTFLNLFPSSLLR